MKITAIIFTCFIFLTCIVSISSAQIIEFESLNLHPNKSCYNIDKFYYYRNEGVVFIILKPHKVKGKSIGECGCPSSLMKVKIFNKDNNEFIGEQIIDSIRKYEIITLENIAPNDLTIKFDCYVE